MVINLFKYLIENYINNMTINDLIMFSEKENIFLEYEEYLKIYDYIKNNWELLLTDETTVERYINNNFDTKNAEKILNLFSKYQKKYRAYL